MIHETEKAAEIVRSAVQIQIQNGDAKENDIEQCIQAVINPTSENVKTNWKDLTPAYIKHAGHWVFANISMLCIL